MLTLAFIVIFPILTFTYDFLKGRTVLSIDCLYN